MELLITVVIAVIVLYAAWYCVRFLPEPMQQPARLIVGVAGLIWLVLHARQIITALAGS